jgi:recombination protein RecT
VTVGEIATRTAMELVVEQIQHPVFVQQLKESLPENVSLDRFKRVAITAIRSTPELITGDQNTLFAAIVKCAQDGLLPDGREAAFAMYGSDVVYMPMIGGFRKIAADYGWAIDTQVVYANDQFVWELGVNPKLEHQPAGLSEEPGEPLGAYAVATHQDGRKIVEVMRRADIEKSRAVSKMGNKGPWRDWTERMWEKTVGRRIFGKLPLSGKALELAARIMQAHDAEYDLGDEPKMTVDEANVSVGLGVVRPPADNGPDDTLDGDEAGLVVDESDGDADGAVGNSAVSGSAPVLGEPERAPSAGADEQTSFVPPTGPRGSRART